MNKPITTLKRYLLEPMNTLTHLVGAIASFIGLLILLWLTRDNVPKMVSVLIFGMSMVAVYTASTLFHGIKVSGNKRMWLNRLDHMAIFLVIAGTYTPIVFNLFPSPWRWLSLALVWGGALIGMNFKLFGVKMHNAVHAFSYVILGWAGVVPLLFMPGLIARLTLAGSVLLLAGGLVYMIGFVIFYVQRPNPWPDVLEHHEIWHLCVMGGSLCHYLFVLLFVVPVVRV